MRYEEKFGTLLCTESVQYMYSSALGLVTNLHEYGVVGTYFRLRTVRGKTKSAGYPCDLIAIFYSHRLLAFNSSLFIFYRMAFDSTIASITRVVTMKNVESKQRKAPGRLIPTTAFCLRHTRLSASGRCPGSSSHSARLSLFPFFATNNAARVSRSQGALEDAGPRSLTQ